MPLVLLFHYLLLNMFRMLIHPSSGACDLHGLYGSGLMCVGVALWWCGIRMQASHTTTTQHQHTSNQKHTTHAITHQISRKLLRMDVLTSETC